MNLFTRLFLLVAVAVGAVNANEIPGYIGNQSFRLTDDQDLNMALRRAEDAKVNIARAEQAQSQIGDQLRALEGQQRQLQERMQALLRDIDVEKNNRQALVTKLEELKKAPEANAAAITQTEQEIAAKDALILEKNKQAGALKLETAPLNVRVDQVRADFNVAAKKTEEARNRMIIIAREAQNYREELIVALKKINYEGSRVAQQDGIADGADLANRLGYDRGNNDGKVDGFQQGTVDGQDRYYRRGAEQGERDGASRAAFDGQRDGTNEGTISGNKSAGAREGRAAGIKRGDASNAASVGIEQGKKAGMARAVETGAANGRAIGENETTKKLESSELGSVKLDGQFGGSFIRRTPDYPGDFNGNSFRPNISHSKELMRKAYSDGYVYTYRDYTRAEFRNRIDGAYNSYYNSSYKANYDQAVNREYTAHYDQGRREADARAYSRDYPIVKANAFKVAFERQDSSPNRASGEFKASYSESEAFAYAERYEQIRSANYEAKEEEVFQANIAAQTEIYRQKRIAEVTAIYNNNAVLEFVSSEMIDGGIKGVASLDGVFQPGETTNHSVVLRNFGFKAATNVTAVLENGAAIKLPAIPARSVVTVKGAAQSQVNASLNETHKSALRVISPLATNDAVEGRHYDMLSGGIVKSADQKQVRVAYPLALSGLALESQLLKGAKNKLKITLTNNSKREYKGDLKVRLLVNSQNPIITKEFAAISSLQSSATLSDAEVLVDAEQDAYRDLSFSASIEQNGVQIGVLPKDFLTMAKAKFFDKGQVPVIVANSATHLNSFLDVLSAAGGSEKVSILDLSLADLNSATVANGLSKKVLLIVDDASGSSIKTLNGFIAKSQTSAFVFVDESLAGAKNVLTLPSLKDAPKLLLNKRQIAFSNPHRAAGVLKASAFFQSNLQSFTRDLALAQTLTLSAPEMIQELKTKVTPENFGTPNETIKIFSLRALSEILSINVAYDESGGIFNRDKKWAKMIEEDTSLFHNQLKAASAGDVVVSKLPFVLSAVAMKDLISNAMAHGEGISRDMKLKIQNTTNGVLGDMEDSFKKSFKNNFKQLYNTAYEKAALHRPFNIVVPDQF